MSIATEMLEALETMANFDFNQQASIKFYGKLHKNLLNLGYMEFAENIATAVEVQLPNDLITDAQIAVAASLYAAIISNMIQAFKAQGFTNPERAVLSSAAKMTLKLE